MYPNKIIFGLTLYDILLCVAIIACFLVLRIYSDKIGIKIKVQQFTVICGVCAVILGYGSAVLFQAFYNIGKIGHFEITANTGATFYGGLIGGAAVFLLMYFGIGHFVFKDKREHTPAFFDVANCVAPGIALAHSIGRIGCLMAGCCHGAKTDAWYGIFMHTVGGESGKFVPVQLFEAIFLLLLFGFMTLRVLDKKGYNLPVYLIAYGIWRFFAEYLRADYRGTTLVTALTPSQLTAIILVCVGIGLIFVEREVAKRISERTCAEVAADATAPTEPESQNVGDEIEKKEDNGDETTD